MKLASLAIFVTLFSAPAFGRKQGVRGNSNNNNQQAESNNNVFATLDDDEIADLLFMREEEKMARDVYLTLDQLYNADVVTFANIAKSEQQHMDRMLSMIERYGLTDPVVDENEIGTFQNTDLQALYDVLIVNGTASLLDGLHVGALIEEVDIGDLERAISDSDEKTLDRVYGNLKRASYNHLRAFVRDIEALGVEYKAQHLSQEEVDEILSL